jgi:hypothetical protein
MIIKTRAALADTVVAEARALHSYNKRHSSFCPLMARLTRLLALDLDQTIPT